MQKLDGNVLDYQTPKAPAQRSTGLAVFVLVWCCLLWGYSFPVMQFSAGAFEGHVLGAESSALDRIGARATFNGVRFSLAGVGYAGMMGWGAWRGRVRRMNSTPGMLIPAEFVARRRTRVGGGSKHGTHEEHGTHEGQGTQEGRGERSVMKWGRPELMGGVVVGIFFAAGMLFQVMGLRWTLPSISAFLTSLPVVFAPVAQALLLRRRVGGVIWLAVGVAIVGVVLLSWPKEDIAAQRMMAVAPPIPGLGEMLTVAAALLFTAEIIALDWFGKGVKSRPADPTGVTFIMLATTGVLSLIAGLMLGGPKMLSPRSMQAIFSDRTIWWTLSTLVLFSSVMALSLMSRFQPRVSPAVASVVYCTEPIFSTLFSIAFATETLTLVTVLGGMTVLGAVGIVVGRGRGREGMVMANGEWRMANGEF